MKKMVKVAALAAMVMSVALTGCNGKNEEVSPSNTEASAKSKSPMKAPKIPSYLYRIKYQGMIWLGAKDKDRLPADLVIPEGVTGILKDAFLDCTSLASVTIPNSVKAIHDTAFLSCPIKEFKYAGTKEQWESISKGSALSTEGVDFVVQCTDDITEDAVVSSATE